MYESCDIRKKPAFLTRNIRLSWQRIQIVLISLPTLMDKCVSSNLDTKCVECVKGRDTELWTLKCMAVESTFGQNLAITSLPYSRFQSGTTNETHINTFPWPIRGNISGKFASVTLLLQLFRPWLCILFLCIPLCYSTFLSSFAKGG